MTESNRLSSVLACISDLKDLTDRIYEAGAIPEFWPDVIDEVSALSGGVGGFLFAVRDTYTRAIASGSLAAECNALMNEGWGQREPRLPRAREINHPGFLSDQDLFSDEEMDANEVYRDFYRKRGIGCVAGTLIPNPSGDSIVFAFQYDHGRGPVSRRTIDFLDGLRPYLARASMLSFRLGLERAGAMADALAMLGLPGAVLRGKGRVYAANPLFEALMPGLMQDRHERLTLTDAEADHLLADALARLPLGAGTPSVSSIPVAAAEDRPPMILHLLPIRGAAHDVFSQATSVLVVTPVDRGAVPNAQVLQGLFDLTPAESRLAGLIGQAQTPRDAALALGITEETARTTLKRIFSKTGTRRQAELVRLLGGPMLGALERK